MGYTMYTITEIGYSPEKFVNVSLDSDEGSGTTHVGIFTPTKTDDEVEDRIIPGDTVLYRYPNSEHNVKMDFAEFMKMMNDGRQWFSV